MKKCLEDCIKSNKACKKEECRAWIDYERDLNCSSLSIKKHGNLTLAETAERLKLSIVRVKQLQDRALQKLQKNRRLRGL